uniref:Uncharacterized protein n=1 Tax=Chromera velia CCMP2878 TaxID=1169474 RepID=A0A0G4GBE0_9ALVE|eukprot:Cvel_21085.t1-p1 / transcript=Cvel_21085.t1 / gene=Cvel_21085 / organism=Chromera_velia_CCMP2878 / gene_product=hypothetical protein / transcript_product=hypothetical protein / location=Cvel_scaffold1949:22321-23295(-) / protein_length=325 / sequence_SO=supercontig / SO=protein_coding / is_pseudo=false
MPPNAIPFSSGSVNLFAGRVVPVIGAFNFRTTLLGVSHTGTPIFGTTPCPVGTLPPGVPALLTLWTTKERRVFEPSCWSLEDGGQEAKPEEVVSLRGRDERPSPAEWEPTPAGWLCRRPGRLLTALFLLSLLSARMWEADTPGHPPSPPDLEAHHLLARIGGFGGDINVALHSIEGNIPLQGAKEGAGDAQNGGKRDEVSEADDRLIADVDTSDVENPSGQSLRDRPSRPPSRVPSEEKFTRHPHPTQRWANPILAATAPAQRETAGSAASSMGPLFLTRLANNKRKIRNAPLPGPARPRTPGFSQEGNDNATAVSGAAAAAAAD